MDRISRKLAEYSASVATETLPDAAVKQVHLRITDAIGCALVGILSPPVLVLHGLLKGREVEDGCLVWGTGKRTTPEIAALINGSAVRFLDFNDRMLGGHPSDNIPAVIAACEMSGRGIEDVIAGVAVNYEIYGELGRLIIRDRGWDQGTTSVVASACAVGRALGLTIDQLGHAIGIAATANIATRQTRRGHLSMWKGVAAPYASQAGLIAACLAQEGMTGPGEPFAGGNGFFEQVLGTEFEVEGLDDPRDPKYILNADFKYWPIEFNGQNAVWLGRAIRETVALEKIKSIDVETYEWAWKVIGKEPEKWVPTTRETADHSLPFALAVAIVDGFLGLEHFTPAAIADEATRELMSRILVRPANDLTELYPVLAMRAVVETVDGASHRFEVRDPRGHHANPMTETEIYEKFNRLAAQSPLSQRGPRLLEALRTMGRSGNLQTILEPLTLSELE